jgi:hypothetical protein
MEEFRPIWYRSRLLGDKRKRKKSMYELWKRSTEKKRKVSIEGKVRKLWPG